MALSRIAIIGDVHSNVIALQAAIDSICSFEADTAPLDQVVFMGDFLSYGVRPNETLETVLDFISNRSSTILLGNHDSLYKDLLCSSPCSYSENLPPWIKEIIDYNYNLLDVSLFSQLHFQHSFTLSSVLFAHANFSFLDSGLLDWSYVNSPEDYFHQLTLLSQHQLKLGILGHTHRTRLFSLPSNPTSDFFHPANRKIEPFISADLLLYNCSVLNAGSIGQPREVSCPYSSWILLDIADETPTAVTLIPLSYDIDRHLHDISAAGLSPFCTQKLISFF
jgi:predicted phosphodiesterase